MKRSLSFILALCLLLGLYGCHRQEEPIESPVTFYYRQAEVVYGDPEGLIGPCVSEGAGYEDDLPGLLNRYLQGPENPAFINPFPGGCRVVKLTIEDRTATVTLNGLLARYREIALSVACACLSLTIMELTGTDVVCIQTNTALLDGAESITMTKESILLSGLVDEDTK